ncbi:MAG: hypothetical protein LBI62_09465 [Candidatus Accumulibacter sp.]|nr:hypothetical protein [Accumulibacter sp.]
MNVSGKRMMIGSFAVAFLFMLSVPVAKADTWKCTVSECGEYRRDDSSRRADDSRRGPPHRWKGNHDKQRSRRLSPEERSQLRRDIRNAGREIYPPRRHVE